MKFLSVLFLLFFSVISFSQDDWWNTEKDATKTNANQQIIRQDSIQKEFIFSKRPSFKEDPISYSRGNTTVNKSSLVDKIIDYKAATIPPYTGAIMDGFRVQLFFDQDKVKVDEARAKALKINPKMETYIKYQAPNYYLMMGNYRTKLAAERARASLISDFPAAIVQDDKIYLPKLYFDEQEDK